MEGTYFTPLQVIVVWLGVQIDYDAVHLRTFLVKLFVLLQLNFKEVVQIIELMRFGGAPNGYPFAALCLVLQVTYFAFFTP
jgi:hypothetical protein